MRIVITREDIIAYAEVDYIINHMNEKYQEMIPESIRNFFATIKEPGYDVNINPRKPLVNQGLRQYTLEIIALLHLKYWCQDEERKKELYNKMKQNQMKIEEKIQGQYGIENLFSESNGVFVTSNDDFSKPKKTIRYNQVTEKKSDITDYSNITEKQVEEKDKNKKEKEKSKKELKDNNKVKESKDCKDKFKKDKEKAKENKTDVKEENTNKELTSVKEKTNIFDKLTNFIKNIFKKK